MGASDRPFSFLLCSALRASPSPALDSAGLLSEQKCFGSVCDFQSLGTVYGLWDEPAAGGQCGRRLASSLLLGVLGDSSPSTRAFPRTEKPGKRGDVPSLQARLPALSPSQQGPSDAVIKPECTWEGVRSVTRLLKGIFFFNWCKIDTYFWYKIM